MDTLLKQLKRLATEELSAVKLADQAHEAFMRTAKKCKYYQSDDELDCHHPDEYTDPVCASSDCPLIK